MKPPVTFYPKPQQATFTTSRQTTSGYDIHYHSFYEIYYFVSGDADYLVEGREYHLTPHSLILLPPLCFHGVRVNSNSGYTRSVVQFSPECLSPEHRTSLLSSFPGIRKEIRQEVYYEHTEDYSLQTCLTHLIASQNQPKPQRDEYYSIFLEALLAQISVMCQTLHPAGPASTAAETITNIIGYLNGHLTENISLDSLSQRFFISKYYMNRAFKKATGTTVMDYLIYKRVVMAKQLILNGHTAADAGLMTGFGDYSAFYRAYKKIMGCGPASDRRSSLPHI